jgi:SecD-like export protein
MSRGLFYVIAVVAIVATVAGVLSLRGGGDDDASLFGGKDDPVLDAKVRALQFYDWETKVIGPGGRPAPADPRVTGGSDAGSEGALPLYDAVVRAARRAAVIETDNGRAGSLFFAVDPSRRRVIGNAAPTRAAALAGDAAGATVAEVRPGTAIVAADGSTSRFYVLDDDVAIDGTSIREARQGTDESSGRPVTLFAFDDAGNAAFRRLTKAIAERGSNAALDAGGDNPQQYNQHFAVVYEGAIVTAPAVDFLRSPEGLDASAGTQLAEQLP